MHALEVGLFFEPCSLTSSELRVDQYELWTDGLGLHGRARSYQQAQTGASRLSTKTRRLLPTLRRKTLLSVGMPAVGLPSKGDRVELLRIETGERVRLVGTVFAADHATASSFHRLCRRAASRWTESSAAGARIRRGSYSSTSTISETLRLKSDPSLNDERAEWEFGCGSVLQSLQRLSSSWGSLRCPPRRQPARGSATRRSKPSSTFYGWLHRAAVTGEYPNSSTNEPGCSRTTCVRFAADEDTY